METKKLRKRAMFLLHEYKIISKLVDLFLAISKKLFDVNDKILKELEDTVEKLKKG